MGENSMEGKVVNMYDKNSSEEGAEGITGETGKRGEPGLSMDQVINIANQLHQENAQLKQELNRVSNEAAYIRMDYLLRIVSNPEAFKTSMVEKALNEIEKALFSEESEE